jgi:hypothetical protein
MKNIQIQLDGDLINISVDCEKKTGSISSTLKIPVGDKDTSRLDKLQYNSAIDALESLILAHACAGIDVESVEYEEGIESAIDSIAAQYL